jgi:hypothetical protein
VLPNHNGIRVKIGNVAATDALRVLLKNLNMSVNRCAFKDGTACHPANVGIEEALFD